MLIPTAHSGSRSHSPPQPDPLLSKAPLGRMHSGLQSPPLGQRLGWAQQYTCPHLGTALNLLTYVRFMFSHMQCTCLRTWDAQEKRAGVGHLLQPGLCAHPSPRGDFFRSLSSQLEPWHPHPSLHLTVPVKEPPRARAGGCLAKALLLAPEDSF